MKKFVIASVFAVGISLITGCAVVRAPVSGLWYTDTVSSVAATSNQAGNRVGESCATTILGLIGTGDASIEEARRAGGITQITSVDEKANNILGIYGKYCTIVRGR